MHCMENIYSSIYILLYKKKESIYSILFGYKSGLRYIEFKRAYINVLSVRCARRSDLDARRRGFCTRSNKLVLESKFKRELKLVFDESAHAMHRANSIYLFDLPDGHATDDDDCITQWMETTRRRTTWNALKASARAKSVFRPSFLVHLALARALLFTIMWGRQSWPKGIRRRCGSRARFYGCIRRLAVAIRWAPDEL